MKIYGWTYDGHEVMMTLMSGELH